MQVLYCPTPFPDLDPNGDDDPTPLPGQKKVQIGYDGVYSCDVGEVSKDLLICDIY